MSKKFDLKFTPDVDTFLKNNPVFAISKPVPNTGAIRAILKGGGKLDGVEFVDSRYDIITDRKHDGYSDAEESIAATIKPKDIAVPKTQHEEAPDEKERMPGENTRDFFRRMRMKQEAAKEKKD